MKAEFARSVAAASHEIDTLGDPERLEYRHPGVRMHFWAGGFPKIGGLQPIVHWHENFELCLVTRGSMTMLVGGELMHLEEGDFIFVNSGQFHKLGPDGDKEGRYSMAIVHPSILGCEEGLRREFVAPMLRRKWVPFVMLRRGRTGTLPAVFARMVECEDRPDEATAMEAVGIAFELWAAMMRAFRDAGALAPDTAAGLGVRRADAEFDAVRAMVSFIQSQCGERLTLGKIAAAGRVCRSLCCEMFGRHLGQSPIAYLNAYRLERAFKLLRETRDPIADVAFACGFSNQSYFTRQFKTRFGLTPLKARARARSRER